MEGPPGEHPHKLQMPSSSLPDLCRKENTPNDIGPRQKAVGFPSSSLMPKSEDQLMMAAAMEK